MNLNSRRLPVARKIVSMCVAASAVWCASASQAADQPVVGLITKTDTNPFFVKMKQGAEGGRVERRRQADDRRRQVRRRQREPGDGDRKHDDRRRERRS